MKKLLKITLCTLLSIGSQLCIQAMEGREPVAHEATPKVDPKVEAAKVKAKQEAVTAHSEYLKSQMGIKPEAIYSESSPILGKRATSKSSMTHEFILDSGNTKIKTTFDPQTNKPIATEHSILNEDTGKFDLQSTTKYNLDGSLKINTIEQPTNKQVDTTTEFKDPVSVTAIDLFDTSNSSAVKSTDKIVAQRQTELDNINGSPVRAENLVDNVSKDKNVTLTKSEKSDKTTELLNQPKEFSFSRFIDSFTNFFRNSVPSKSMPSASASAAAAA